MTAICYVGIEISANFQKVLLGIEITMLLVLSIVALVKVGNGHAPPGHLTPSWTWFNPFDVPSPQSFMVGFTLMLFIYWGWDTAVSVNEETKERDKIPGRAAVTSTVILLATYALVIMSTQSYAGIGTTGIGLQNPNHNGRRADGARHLHLRDLGIRQLPHQAAHADGAELGRRLDPDHDPADRPDHAVHGGVQGHPERVRQDPQALPDADDVDARPWAASPSPST